jgi:LmbE family N-acetylglucosaminyl deacetylase
MKNKKALVIAAHPDDEILGCGGTIARLINEGYETYTLVLGRGITARGKKRKWEIEELKKQMEKANKLLGIKKVFSYDFPDNKFDSVPLLDIVKKVETVKSKIKPEIIFTHFREDLNIDHRRTYDAVVTATRPMEDETVKTIYSFEVLSSTEWKYPISFSPNVFFDISKTLSKKIEAMSYYKSELREFPHPRSLKAIKLNAEMWGVKVGLKHAEAFQLVRSNIA